jgi:hypothetical protein
MRTHFLKVFTLYSIFLGAVFIIFSSHKFKHNGEDDYTLKNYIRYDDHIYDDSIKTVLLHNLKSQMSYPIINMKGNEFIKLSFDDLKRENSIYNYTVIHCDATWEPSDLEQNEYLDGFFEDEIFNFEFSVNTDIYYTNYTLKLPNENMRLTLSGNYVLMVYKINDKEHPILTK